MPATEQDPISKARKAFRDGDIGHGGRIVHGILRGNINNPDAWSLLYTYLGKGKSFDEFRDRFVRNYYPNQYEAFRAGKAEAESGPFRRVNLSDGDPIISEQNGKLEFPRPKTGPAPLSRQIESKKEKKPKWGLKSLLSSLFGRGKSNPAGQEKPKRFRNAGRMSFLLRKRAESAPDPEAAAEEFVPSDPAQKAVEYVHTPPEAEPENVDRLVKKAAEEIALAEKTALAPPEPEKKKDQPGKAPLISALVRRSDIRLVIADDIEQTRENIRKLLLFEPAIEVVGVAASGREAVEIVSETQPDVVLLDINMPDMDGLRALHLIRERSPLTQVVMLTVQDDPGYLREALQLGARDYLIKPPMIDDLLETVRKAAEIGKAERDRIDRRQRQQAATLEAETGRARGFTMAVYSPKGGVGCTMLAANMAVALAASKESVVLVDGNLQYGGVGLLFKQTARTAISDLAPFVSELDIDVVESACQRHEASGARLLLAQNRVGKGDAVSGEQMTALINFLARHYAYVLVDTSSALDELTVSILDAVDQVLLVTTQDIPAINDIRRLLDLLPAIGIMPDKVALVLNQYHTRINITPEKISANLGREFLAVVPLDNAMVVPSINQGKPFMANTQGQISPVGQAVQTLVETLKEQFGALEELMQG